MIEILLSNDDGYFAPGIQKLYHALSAIPEVSVTLVAPEHNRSGASNSLTLTQPLFAREIGPKQFAVNGTPADCVHLALTGLFPHRPDLVVSGINDGANMGDDTLYSGTVAAAMEGYLMGIPAIAFSMTRKPPEHWDTGVHYATDVVRQAIAKIGHQKAQLLNINIPDLPLSAIKGVKAARLGRRQHAQAIVPTQSPRGETWYWVGAAGEPLDASPGTDFEVTSNGYVSITPLQVDLTDHAAIAALKTQFNG